MEETIQMNEDNEVYTIAEPPVINYRKKMIVTSYNKISVCFSLFANEILFTDRGQIGRRWDLTLRAQVNYYLFGESDDNKAVWEIVRRNRTIERFISTNDKTGYSEYFDEAIPWARGEIYNAILNEQPKPDIPTRAKIYKKERDRIVKDLRQIFGDYETEAK